MFNRDDVLASYAFDRFGRDASSNSIDMVSIKKMNGGHHPLEYLSMLVNIDLSIRCDAWVHTLWSNWNRLIDEMRVTVAGMYIIYVYIFIYLFICLLIK